MMKRFSVVENGYDIDEVNRFIDRWNYIVFNISIKMVS